MPNRDFIMAASQRNRYIYKWNIAWNNYYILTGRKKRKWNRIQEALSEKIKLWQMRMEIARPDLEHARRFPGFEKEMQRRNR